MGFFDKLGFAYIVCCWEVHMITLLLLLGIWIDSTYPKFSFGRVVASYKHKKKF